MCRIFIILSLVETREGLYGKIFIGLQDIMTSVQIYRLSIERPADNKISRSGAIARLALCIPMCTGNNYVCLQIWQMVFYLVN